MLLGIEKGWLSRQYAEAAKNLHVPFRLVDFTGNNAIKKIQSVDAVIWHWSHWIPTDKRIAPYVLRCAEMMGKVVYPNMNSCWMFDDKLAEKYLLEAVGAPLVDTFIFYDEESAIRWLEKQKYPLVYKLPQGAGSTNVRLIHNFHEGKKVCKVHFGLYGNPARNMNLYYKDKKDYLFGYKELLNDKRILYGINNKGVVLFQKYLPQNTYDIRVTVICEKCIIFNRLTRDNDFRASGSGKIVYEVSEEDLQAIPIAKNISDLIGSQSMAYDFIYDENRELRVIEMSYGFVAKAVYDAPGWYDKNLNFYQEKVDIHEYVVQSIVDELKSRGKI